MYLRKIGCQVLIFRHIIQRGFCEYDDELLGSVIARNFLTSCDTMWLSYWSIRWSCVLEYSVLRVSTVNRCACLSAYLCVMNNDEHCRKVDDLETGGTRLCLGTTTNRTRTLVWLLYLTTRLY